MSDPNVSTGSAPGREAEVVSLLKEVAASFGPAALASSFGVEDMVLLDLIGRQAPTIEVFTLDTGRLPAETYRLMAAVRERYPIAVRLYLPNQDDLENYLRKNGPNAFYDSVAQRQECCHIRKVAPLARALRGKKAWITGLRREQSLTRERLETKVWDEANGLYKFSPLADWTLEEVWAYIRENGVPYNELHDQGFPSIGCAPCTRAVRAGEDIRSGRWWWETANTKECGLHAGR